MTKNQLKSYRIMQQRIEALKIEINAYKTFACVKSSDHNVKVYGYDVNESDILQSLWEEKRTLKLKCDSIRKYIENIEDYQTRKIFEYRYLWGSYHVSWQKVAELLGGGNTYDSVRKIHDRFLEKI